MPLPVGADAEAGDDGEAPLLSPAEGGAPPQMPKWYTPKRLLALFCVMQYMVYMDRGVIASTGVKGARATADTPGSGIAGRFNLSESQDGGLYSAFMIGLLFGSPAFAEASKYYNPLRIIAVGLGAWVLSTAGCAASSSFGSLVFFRCAVGLGEASFCSLASPFIDDAAPPGQKTRWLALFFMCIPVGVASGFILGKVMGDPLGWRAPFAAISVAMIPFVVFCAVAEPISLRGLSPAAPRPRSPAPGSSADADGDATGSGGVKPRNARALLRAFGADVMALMRVPVFVPICIAWAAHTATIGCYSYYGPKAAKEIFSLDAADTVFGALTVLTGITGCLAGGLVLDKWNASVTAALRFCAAACGIAFVLLMLAFQAPRLGGFIPLFAAGELFLFSIGACVSAAVLWSVPLRLRSLSMSVTTIAIHVLGDVPAPPLVGRFQDSLVARYGPRPSNWRLSLGIVTLTLAVSGLLFHTAAQLAKRLEVGEPVAGEAAAAGVAGGEAGGEGAATPPRGGAAANGIPEEDTFFSPLPMQDATPRRTSPT